MAKHVFKNCEVSFEDKVFIDKEGKEVAFVSTLVKIGNVDVHMKISPQDKSMVQLMRNNVKEV